MPTTNDEARADVRVLRAAYRILTCWYWAPLWLAVLVWFALGWLCAALATLQDVAEAKVFGAYLRWRPTGVPDRDYIFPEFHRGGVYAPAQPPVVGERASGYPMFSIAAQRAPDISIVVNTGAAGARTNAIAGNLAGYPMPRGLQ